MKRIVSLISVIVLLLSCLPAAAFAEGEQYTFTLTPSATSVNEGDTFTVDLTVTGSSFNAYSAVIKYGSNNQDALELLDCTVPCTDNKTAHTVSIKAQGDELFESGTTVAVLTFGVKDIASRKTPTVTLTSAHADISENAVSENAKNAVLKGDFKATCNAVTGTVSVSVRVKAVPEGGGTAFAAVSYGSTDRITDGTVTRGSTYYLFADANEGYEFVGWRFYESETIVSSSSAYSFKFDYDTVATAVFEPVVYDESILDAVGIIFAKSAGLPAAEGYETSLTVLPVPISIGEYHLYKGESTDTANEIPMRGDTFYLPEGTDKLTLTCTYMSGTEPKTITRVIDVDAVNAVGNAAERMVLPGASTHATGYVINGSVDIYDSAVYIDPVTGEATLYGAGGYSSGVVMSTGSSANVWSQEDITGGGQISANVYPAKGHVVGDGGDTVIWYYSSSPAKIFRYNGETWERLTVLENLTGGLITDKKELRILPLDEGKLFITIGYDAYIFDGENLEKIDGAGYSILPQSFSAGSGKVVINDYNGAGQIDVYDAAAGNLSTLPIHGTVLGSDDINGSSNVIFVRDRSNYYMYDVDSGTSTPLDLSALFSSPAESARALNRAADGYIYALVLASSAPAAWMPNSGIAIQGEIAYIWRTNDFGETWELVDSGNVYDHEAAATIEGNDDTPATPDPTLYSDAFAFITNPAKGVTLITGYYGAVCAVYGTTTITFVTGEGGSAVEPITQRIRSYVAAPQSPTNGDKIFAGWYLDPDCSDGMIYSFGLMPGKDITLYAKWSDDPAALDAAKQAALETLAEAYASYDPDEYPEEGWKELTREYNSGINAINAAGSYDAIQEALAEAMEKMASVEKSGTITVAVTVETLTVNGEYIIEPILVEADSYEKASVVLIRVLEEHFPGVAEPYRINGTVQNSFYLKSVYDPDFAPDPEKGYVQNYAGYLSEFDCGEQSGWMYCVNGTFPGVGASGWNLKNGDVMRWQYSCTGLGADIGNDNSAWGSSSGTHVADKDELIWRVAEINEDREAFFDEAEGNEEAYDNAMEVLKKIDATQQEVDDALTALGGTAETPEEKLQKAKDAAAAALNAYDPDDYRETERALLEQYVAEGIEAINDAETVDEVSDALASALSKIDTLITDEQYKAIEEASNADIDKIYADTGAYMAGLGAPRPGSIGGEWMAIGLARAGYNVPDDWATQYYANAQNYITENMDENGRLNPSRSTDNARMILALTAVGKDPRDVAGVNLTEALADLDYLKKQGINGPIWALIAFDSHEYEIPQVTTGGTQVTRELLVDTILAAQKEDGGWNLSESAAFSDTDMTAMAIQALAPYYDSDPEVKDAVNRALAMLSRTQNPIGGYSSYGVANSESVAQVITALTALGIDPSTDSRFIKNGNTLINNLATYAEDGGGFRHIQDSGLDGMATEQGYYSLASWYRLREGKTSLYDMSDVELDTAYENVEKLIDAIGEPVTLEDEAKIKAARDAYEALSDEQKTMVDEGKLQKLEDAEEAISDLKVARAEELIDAIGSPVRLSDENAIATARNYYNNSLSDEEREKVSNYDKLTAAEAALQKLKNETPQGHTTSVTVTINGITYEVSEATKKAVEAMQAITDPADPADRLPEDFRDLTPEKEQQILDAYMLYQALSPDEKLFATNYESFYEDVLLKLGRNYHYDERTKTDARNNDDDVLPWYVKLEVSDDEFSEEELERIAEALGEDFNLEKLYRISFTDVFTGEPFTAYEPVNVRFPLYETQGRRTYAFVYEREDGSLEFIEGRVVDGELVMDRADFGRYGLADSSLTWEEIVSGCMPQKSSHSWIWLAVSGAALIGLIIFFIIWKRRKDDEEEEQA